MWCPKKGKGIVGGDTSNKYKSAPCVDGPTSTVLARRKKGVRGSAPNQVSGFWKEGGGRREGKTPSSLCVQKAARCLAGGHCLGCPLCKPKAGLTIVVVCRGLQGKVVTVSF